MRTELAIRVRQTGPPRESVEVATTLDVSRNGVLFRTRQPYEMHSTVWVIVPYDPKAMGGEVEFPATVVRVDSAADGSSEVTRSLRMAIRLPDGTPLSTAWSKRLRTATRGTSLPSWKRKFSM